MYTEADRQRQTEIRVDGQIATFTDDSSRDRLIDIQIKIVVAQDGKFLKEN